MYLIIKKKIEVCVCFFELNFHFLSFTLSQQMSLNIIQYLLCCLIRILISNKLSLIDIYIFYMLVKLSYYFILQLLSCTLNISSLNS